MYFFPSERRRSLRRGKRSRAGDHARERTPGKASFPREEKKRAAELARDIIYGKPFYAVNSEIGYFASSREKAEQFAEAAELFYRDIFVSHYDREGRLLINAEQRDIIRGCARGLHSRTDDVGSLLCGDCAEGSVLSRESGARSEVYGI